MFALSGQSNDSAAAEELAGTLVLSALLDRLRLRWGGYTILDHWQQGEFHHDLVLELVRSDGLPSRVLVVATNCNAGVKEVLALEARPIREGLWHLRCPDNHDFSGPAPHVLAHARTFHWFDPCELLTPDARSEYRAEYRERQCGGGWIPRYNVR
jgi:hypothetical protein